MKTQTSKAASSMEELLAKSSFNVKGFTRGEKVDAKVVNISSKTAIFDLGSKSEGVINGIYFEQSKEFLRSLKSGETVRLTVIEPETREGIVLLSARSAASDSTWDRFEAYKKEGKELTASVKSVSGSGASVEIEGVGAFVPSSQLGKKAASAGESLVGKTLKVKVMEVDKSKRRVLVSEKAVSEAGHEEEVQKAISELKKGEIYDGEVTQLTNFGAFVAIKEDKTAVEGLVHVSELSWEKQIKPEDIVKIGDKIKVKVLGLRDGKLSLSLKQAQKDPWEAVAEKIKVDDKLKGKVTKQSDFGVFVELFPGVEGLIHVTKIPPATKLEKGKEINVTVEEIDPKAKKISLGLVLTSKPIGYK